MLIKLTVNASRVNMAAEDLLKYNGNPLVAPKGLIHTGLVNNLANLISSYRATELDHSKIRLANLGNPPGAFMSAPAQNPTMYLTTDGAFVFNKHHQNVAVRTLVEHMEEIKNAYPEGADIRIVSMSDVGNTYINMGGGEVVSFEEVRGTPVTIKRDEAGKWVGFNRITGEWVEVQLHLNVEGQFRVETVDLVHLTLTTVGGTEVILQLDSEGWIHGAESYEEDIQEHSQISEFTLLDTNPIFKFLIPEGWEPAPAQTAPNGNKNVVGPLIGGPLGTSW